MTDVDLARMGVAKAPGRARLSCLPWIFFFPIWTLSPFSSSIKTWVIKTGTTVQLILASQGLITLGQYVAMPILGWACCRSLLEFHGSIHSVPSLLWVPVDAPSAFQHPRDGFKSTSLPLGNIFLLNTQHLRLEKRANKLAKEQFWVKMLTCPIF